MGSADFAGKARWLEQAMPFPECAIAAERVRTAAQAAAFFPANRVARSTPATMKTVPT